MRSYGKTSVRLVHAENIHFANALQLCDLEKSYNDIIFIL